MAEEEAGGKEGGQPRMMSEQDIVVGGQRAEFGESLPHVEEGLFHSLNGNGINFLEKRHARLPVRHDEQGTLPRSARYDEVRLGIARPLPLIDI